MIERPPRPVNIARKVNLHSKRNHKYISFINDFENNPLHYFNTQFNNKPFIIGKNYSQSPYAKDTDTSLSKSRSKSNYRIKRKSNITFTYAAGQIKSYISDSDLALIYQKADSRKVIDDETEDREISNKPLSQLNYYLKQQEKHLKKYDSLSKRRLNLSASLSKKLNRDPNMLLLNKQELYRPKKEVLDSISYKDININSQFAQCLRQNTTEPNIKSTTIPSNTIIENTEGKIERCQLKEIIRNPSCDLIYNKNKNPLANNSHLKNKFSSIESFYNAVYKPSYNLRKICLKGVDLLLFEKTISKKLKGPKILYLEKRASSSFSISPTKADKTKEFLLFKK